MMEVISGKGRDHSHDNVNNFDYYDQLAEIINQINGFFSLGKSCSFNSEIGKVKLLCKYFMILSPRCAE